jgi:dihydrofolate reductase
MRKVVWSEYVSLDGVVEEPGEWSIPFFSDDLEKYKSDELFASDALLLGRVTYEGFAAAWPDMPHEGEFFEGMNSIRKYVASTTLSEPEWNNSVVIEGDVPEAVGRLKQEEGKNILIGGSGNLAETLTEHGLIDEFRFLIHPVMIGGGKRLFDGVAEPTALELVDTQRFESGVVALTFQST